MSEELGMKCPKCGRVCRAEIVDNGPNVTALAHCCGWAFDGWPDTPFPPKRGGKRQGAGRKAGPAKVAITVRVTQDAAANFDAYRKSKKLSQSRAFEAWASKLKTA